MASGAASEVTRSFSSLRILFTYIGLVEIVLPGRFSDVGCLFPKNNRRFAWFSPRPCPFSRHGASTSATEQRAMTEHSDVVILA
jgi:hypothetical protein